MERKKERKEEKEMKGRKKKKEERRRKRRREKKKKRKKEKEKEKVDIHINKDIFGINQDSSLTLFWWGNLCAKSTFFSQKMAENYSNEAARDLCAAMSNLYGDVSDLSISIGACENDRGKEKSEKERKISRDGEREREVKIVRNGKKER